MQLSADKRKQIDAIREADVTAQKKECDAVAANDFLSENKATEVSMLG